MLLGVPVVATPMALEGMHVKPGEAVVAEGAQAFARALASTYVDERRWRSVAAAARASAAEHFSVAKAAARWARLEDALVPRRRRNLDEDDASLD